MIVVGVHLRFRIAADAGLTAVAAADAHSAVNVDAVELVERVSERKILIKRPAVVDALYMCFVLHAFIYACL